MIMIGRTLHCHAWAPEEARHASACHALHIAMAPRLALRPTWPWSHFPECENQRSPTNCLVNILRQSRPFMFQFFPWVPPSSSSHPSPGFHFFYFILKLLFQQASMDRRTHPALSITINQPSCTTLRDLAIAAMAPKQGSGSKEFCKKFLCPGSPRGFL